MSLRTRFECSQFHVANNRSPASDGEQYRLVSKLVVEFIGDLIFVFIGISQALANETLVNAAFSHGLTIFVLASSLGHISGGHFNPAVTATIVFSQKMSAVCGMAYIAAQLLGGFCGALLAQVTSSTEKFIAINAGATTLSVQYEWYQGLIVEVIATFVLTQTVMLTAVNTSSNILTPLAIGSSIIIDILACGAISGASMNPARSFGPALVSLMFGVNSVFVWRYHFIYWIGPLLGSLITVAMNKLVYNNKAVACQE